MSDSDFCMKITLNFDDRLIKAAKVRAAEDGEPLTHLIERAIRQYLQLPQRTEEPFKLKLVTKRFRTMPGVDFADRNSLYDILDGLD